MLFFAPSSFWGVGRGGYPLLQVGSMRGGGGILYFGSFRALRMLIEIRWLWVVPVVFILTRSLQLTPPEGRPQQCRSAKTSYVPACASDTTTK